MFFIIEVIRSFEKIEKYIESMQNMKIQPKKYVNQSLMKTQIEQ